jgi:hypothetical protein
MRNQFCSLRIYRSKNGTAYIPLAKDMWRDAGPCNCAYCKGSAGFWDTLVVPHSGTAYQVHAPELQLGLAEVSVFRLQR